MFKEPINPNKHLVIKTARTTDAINKAADDGYKPLIEPVEHGKDIHACIAVYQHKITGKIELSGDMRWSPGDKFEEVVPRRYYYQYSFPESFAAYLIPPELKEGDVVWLDDIIEDIVAEWGNQGYNPRLCSCEATWTGEKFTIHFDPEVDAHHLIG